MEHDFTPDDAAPWPERGDSPAGREDGASDGSSAEAPVPPPAGRRRDVLLGVLVVLLTGAGTLALLASRESAPAVVNASPPPPAAPALTSAPAVADTDWTIGAPRWVSNADDWLGRSKGAALEVLAAEPVGAWMRNVRPALVVRCTGRRADVFVFTDSAAALEAGTEDHTVSFAFDGEAPISMRWPDGAEHNALFAPDGPGLAQRLMHADTFHFSFTPHNAATVSVRFNTSGLADALKPAAKHCGW